MGKISEGKDSILDYFQQHDIHVAFNTPSHIINNHDEVMIRQQLIAHQIPYSTTIEGMKQVVDAISVYKEKSLAVKPLQEYY